MEKIEINSPMIKLNSLLKLLNIASSGGEAKNMILDNEVKVNGEVCNIIRKQIFPGDVVTVFDTEYKVEEEK